MRIIILTYRFVLLLMLFMLSVETNAQCPGNVYAGDDSTICFSSNVVYLDGKIIRPNGSLGSGTWNNGTGRFVSGTSSLTNQYIPSKSEVDAGYVDLILIPTQNCNPSKADTVHITILSVPEQTISGPSAVCEYSSSNTYSVTSGTGISYDWHVVGGYISSGAATNSISVTWGNRGPGYIYLVRTDALGCVGVSSLDPISRFHFNTDDFDQAAVGPDAVAWDADAYSDGTGFVIDNNCGSSKGIDLEIAGSTFDRGKLAMTFSWQRDESEAIFFERGNTKFYIAGGQLKVQLSQYDTSGNPQTVGPVSTGYYVPSDDVFRYFTFCYDSASGVARVLVNDSIVWDYETGTQSSLAWSGAGNAKLGVIMDGSCSGKPLLDWANISIPVSIYSKPVTSLFGTPSICQNNAAAYYCDTPSYVAYTWSATNGTLLSGQGGPYAEINWITSGAGSANLLLTDTRTGCDSSFSYGVTVNSIPTVQISGDDSLCAGDSLQLTLSTNGVSQTWTGNYNATTSSSAYYALKADSAGSFAVYVSANGSNGCSNADTLEIVVQAYPEPIVSTVSDLCYGDAAVVNVSNVSGVSYTWQCAGASIQNGQGTSEITLNFGSAGNYTVQVEVTDVLFGCSADDATSIVVRPKPVTSPIYH